MKSERERKIPYDIIYMWNLKYGTNENTDDTETHTEKICGCQGGGVMGEERTGSL